MTIKVFYTSVSSNLEIKKQQQRISFVLESKKIAFDLVDISVCDSAKALMRETAGNPTALPPQICNGDVYCGDFTAFENAVENDELETFLKL
ncbi:SH3 domain-binding glutamic acid-rich-like protein 3 [Symphorus nematophorus]